MNHDSIEVERISTQLGPDEALQFIGLSNTYEMGYERFSSIEMGNAIAMIEKLSSALAAAAQREAKLREAITKARDHRTPIGGSFKRWFDEVKNILDAALAPATAATDHIGEVNEMVAASVPESPDGWVKCSERMPEFAHKSSLVLCSSGCITLAAWSVDYEDWIFDDNLDTLAERNARSKFSPVTITHWRPLPLPPAGEGEKQP